MGSWVTIAMMALILPAQAAQVQAQARSGSNVLMAEDPRTRAVQESWGFADAVIAGDLIFLSGLVVAQREGESVEAAFERTYAAAGRVLARAGSSWDDVVDMTSYHSDVAAQFDSMVKVHRRFVKGAPPAWTAIEVKRFVPERGIAEIKITARKAKRRR
jgi:enamine deaminase RidA (YjgF/YER057c/UK114 family)